MNTEQARATNDHFQQTVSNRQAKTIIVTIEDAVPAIHDEFVVICEDPNDPNDFLHTDTYETLALALIRAAQHIAEHQNTGYDAHIVADHNEITVGATLHQDINVVSGGLNSVTIDHSDVRIVITREIENEQDQVMLTITDCNQKTEKLSYDASGRG